MPIWLLIVFSIFLVLVNLFAAVNFAWLPAFFGVYDEARHSARGRLITSLLWLFPFISLVTLVGLWFYPVRAGWLLALPFAYLFFLRAIRANKQDVTGPGKRFAQVKENFDEQKRELEYKWSSWEALNGKPIHLCFDVWLPNKSACEAFATSLSSRGGRLNKETEEIQTNQSVMARAQFSIDEIDRSDIESRIQILLDDTWQVGGELISTEVELTQ